VAFDWTSAAKEAFLAKIRQRRDIDDDHLELLRRLASTFTTSPAG